MSQEAAPPPRKRPLPGERRLQILQTLAGMLEQPALERITTAHLAARLGVSEAALYRHFASKAQMYEGLIEFIEQSVFSMVNQIVEKEQPDMDPGTLGRRQCAQIASVVMQFGQSNPGLARVMVGDALVFENERLQRRMNLFFDKLESAFKQCLREAGRESSALPGSPDQQAALRAGVLIAFLFGRLQRFVRSGFKTKATDQLDESLRLMLG